MNPEFDSPQILKNYQDQFKSIADNWHLLTGKREEIKEIALNSFKLGKIDEPIFHSPHFTLIDRHGSIRGYYKGTEKQEIDKLFADAAKLVKERF